MSNFTSRFNFVGEVVIPKANSKRPFFKEFTGGKTGRTKIVSLNFGIKSNDNNMAFVESFDSIQDEIKTMNKDNEKINIEWKLRQNEDVVAAVANYKKCVIDLGEECGGRKEFVAAYDAINFLNEHLPTYNGKIAVTGQMVKEWYQGQYYDKFKLQNVYAVDDDKKGRLALTIDAFYNKESIDKADYQSEGKIYVNGYLRQYINKDEGSKFIPQQFVFSAAKYKADDPKHQALLAYKLRYIETKSKTMVHIPWEIVLIRGAEAVDFDESMLTPAQKEQVELGIKNIEDFKPTGNIFGDKINEYRLYDPQLKGDFADGLVECEYSNAEFEDLIYTPTQDEKLEDVVNKKDKDAKEKIDDKPPFDVTEDIEDEDLF